MIAVGLDVSELRMGWAVVGYETQEPLALGVESLREKDGGWSEDQVLRAMARVSQNVINLEDVMVVGIEDAYMGPSKRGSLRHASVVGMATMAARVTFGPSVTYWPIPAGSWRKAVGLKPASRKRADVKAATMTWASRRLIDSEVTDLLAEDSADALGIATACALLTERNAA